MLNRLNLFKMRSIFRPLTVRHFRTEQHNPYLESEIEPTEKELAEQAVKPVWDRVFDFRKYLKHEGTIKQTTGLAFIDPEAFPRLKLMRLYYLTLDVCRDLPDKFRINRNGFNAVVQATSSSFKSLLSSE